MGRYEVVKNQLIVQPKTWLITGVAGFIGSNLLEALLRLNQRVVGLDNFSTGSRFNLDDVRGQVTEEQWLNFKLIEGDICDLESCRLASNQVDFILHQAALGSVPRSIEDPISTNKSNIDGFLNMLVAAHDSNVKRFVYAASSSTYGDSTELPKVEDRIGQPLSPYAVTKLVNEMYANVFSRVYDIKVVGLRYFNVFGRRQNPNGAYSAVVPRWISALIANENVYINGDGQTSRDFCYVDNVIQANILGAVNLSENAINQVFNVAVGDSTSLNRLYEMLKNNLAEIFSYVKSSEPTYLGFRGGDIRHSLADITKAKKLLGYEPTHRLEDGIKESLEWYVNHLPVFKGQ